MKHLPFNILLHAGPETDSQSSFRVTLRHARVSDSFAVYSVFASSVKEMCADYYTPEQIHACLQVMDPEAYTESICSDLFLVCELAGNIIGFGRMRMQGEEIAGLFVDPKYAGKGLGTALLRQLELTACSERHTQLHLSATLNSVGFYKMAGYEIISLTMKEVAEGIAIPSVRMNKRLDSSACLPSADIA